MRVELVIGGTSQRLTLIDTALFTHPCKASGPAMPRPLGRASTHPRKAGSALLGTGPGGKLPPPNISRIRRQRWTEEISG